MKDAFISYVRADRYFAKEVREWLEKADISVWQDIKDIKPGDQWEKKIDDAITDSKLVLVILSPEAVKSQYVTYEWSFALGQGKDVIPLIHNPCNMHSKLKSLQFLDCTDDGEQTAKELVTAVRSSLAEYNGLSSIDDEKLESNKKSLSSNSSVVEEKISNIPSFIKVNNQRIAVPIFPTWAEGDYGHDQSGYWAALNFKGTRQIFRWIPPGRNQLGSPESGEGRDSDTETPYQVHFQQGFWLADFPVTQLLYHVVTGDSPSHFHPVGNQDLPVDSVSWLEAHKFILQLNNEIPGLNVSLPLEPQWEYACRAGTSTAFWFGDKINSKQANYNDGIGQTSEYGRYSPNPWGLQDMHGNLWEWCLEPWQEQQKGGILSIDVNSFQAAALNEAKALVKGGGNSSGRPLRGGGWDDLGQGCRSASRIRTGAGYRSRNIGFRLSRSAEQ